MKPLDLSAYQRMIIGQITRIYLPWNAIGIFGSRVTWRADRLSDVDIVLITQKPLDLFLISQIKESLESSALGLTVDVVDYAKASSQFRSMIDESYREILPAFVGPKHGFSLPTLGEFLNTEDELLWQDYCCDNRENSAQTQREREFLAKLRLLLIENWVNKPVEHHLSDNS